MMEVLILADTNQRACISIVRSLSNRDIPFRLALNKGAMPSLSFVRYLRGIGKNDFHFYEVETSEGFIRSLLDCKLNTDDMLILPTGEKYLRWALERKEYLEANKIFLPVVSLRTYRAVSDKESFTNLAREFGIKTPTRYECTPEVFSLPFVVKPRYGDARQSGVLRVPLLVQSGAHFRDYMDLEIDEARHFIQEYIAGPSFYYCALYEGGKKVFGMSQQTIAQEPDGGSVVMAIPCELPLELTSKIDLMMSHLDWFGVMMFEVKRNQSGFYAIECNPRFWGPLQLAQDNGYDFPAALVQIYQKIASNDICGAGKRGGVGYLWFGGFLNGLKKRLISKKRFQLFAPVGGKLRNYRFKDVWLRTDTFCYFFIDIAVALAPPGLGRFMRRFLSGGERN